MQLTLVAAAATLVATASANYNSQYNFNDTYEAGKPYAKVVNRCDYDVNLWSIEKQLGTPSGKGVTLSKGQFYWEKLRNSTSFDDGGISIKISKFDECGSKDHTQLEYKLNWKEGFTGDYLDMSFVNCHGLDCPGRTDGFYFKAGDQKGVQKSAENNEHCPIFQVTNAIEAAAVSYINPDDRQTKFCSNDASIELHLCGGHEPGSDSYVPIAAPSSKETQQAQPSKTYGGHHPEKPSASAVAAKIPEVNVAAAKEAAPAPETTAAPTAPAVKTEVVYETVYVKRHAHGRRHQHFHA